MARDRALTLACQDYEADLVLLHYGDLIGDERERVSAHLAKCAGCAGYLRELAALLPLTAKTDDPPQTFWMDYSRELRHKIDDAVEKKTWWRRFNFVFSPRYLAALGSAAVIILALSFTLGKNIWSTNNQLPDDEIAELLPVAENLEFFRSMDILDDLDLIEFIGGKGSNA